MNSQLSLPVSLTILMISGHSMVGAQIVEGRIVDELRGEPVALVEVGLLWPDASVARSAVTDSVGRYSIAVPEPGSYRVAADHLGYERLETPLLAFAEAKTYIIDFELPSAPIELQGLSVEVETLEEMRRELRMFGVELDALGERFIDAGKMSQRPAASDYGEVLQWQSIPGMRVLWSDDFEQRPPHPFICVRLVAGRHSCAIVALNGSQVTLETALMLPAQNLQAIAVLTPEEATTIYGTGADGGAVLLFTR